MKQVFKKDKLNKVSETPKNKVIKSKPKKKHPQYGTSKLEEDLA